MTLSVGSLFSGIGGLELGLERAGMRVAWQVESDDYALKVLKRHWPRVPKFPDVRRVGAHCLQPVDLICGGFPCQDVSLAGKGAGLEGARSGLWREFRRIIEEVRPRWVLIENAPALRNRGLRVVLCDLHSLGFDASWEGLPASAFGAHHVRDRLFVVAWDASNTHCERLWDVAKWHQWKGWRVRAAIGRDAEPLDRGPVDGWEARPGLRGVGHGLPSDVDRLRTLGNSVCPAVAEHVGRAILAQVRGSVGR